MKIIVKTKQIKVRWLKRFNGRFLFSARASFSTPLSAQILFKTINWQFIFGRMVPSILPRNSSHFMGSHLQKRILMHVRNAHLLFCSWFSTRHHVAFNFYVLPPLVHVFFWRKSHLSKEFSIVKLKLIQTGVDISLGPSFHPTFSVSTMFHQ